MVTEILNCTFSNCVSQDILGVTSGDIQSPVIENNIFNTTSNGCVINAFGRSYIGGYYPGYGNPVIIGNVFQNLKGTAFLMGVNLPGNSTATFVNNTVVNCSGGVNATDPWDALIQDNIFVSCTNAVMDSGSLSRQVSYNNFFGNATNFTGYPGTYGTIIWANRNGTPADALYNIYQTPLFIAANDFRLTNNSPCINAGTPNPAYANMCSPPSISTNFPDQGAYGGPNACNWLDPVPILPAQLSLIKSNNLLWLNFGAIPRSTYQVQYIATNLNATSGTNRWLTNTTLIPMAKPVSIAVLPYPTTNYNAFYRVKSLGRTPGN
jgi:hypothetical protein